MSEERRLILKMLVEGKLTVEEADRLLSAIEGTPPEKEDPMTALLTRVAHEVQKNLNEAGDELRKIREHLRTRLETRRKRNSTVTVEVEEEDSSHDNSR